VSAEERAGTRSEPGLRAPTADDPAILALPRVAMLFTASTWTFNVRLGRSGREEGEGVIIVGELSYRSRNGDRNIHPARAMVVKTDSRKRLELRLAPQDAVLTVPLEPFAMQRLQDRLKDLISFYGMTLRVAFSAAETAEPQGLDGVDFAFSAQSGGTGRGRERER